MFASRRLELKPGQQVLGATFRHQRWGCSAGERRARLSRSPVLDVLHSIIFDKGLELYLGEAVCHSDPGQPTWARR